VLAVFAPRHSIICSAEPDLLLAALTQLWTHRALLRARSMKLRLKKPLKTSSEFASLFTFFLGTMNVQSNHVYLNVEWQHQDSVIMSDIISATTA
jgi:hypothetical protein